MTNIESILEDVEANIFISYFDDSIDNICVITPTGGYAPTYSFGGVAYREPTFQIRIRDTSYANGYERAETIFELLNQHSDIYSTSDILSLGKDDKNRSEFTLNFRVVSN